MANTYSSLFYHLIFSTKNRMRLLDPGLEQRAWEYLGGIARRHKMTALQVGGIEDHVHTLVLAPATIAPSQIAQFLKGDSSKWINDEFRMRYGFAWQDGYGAFTVSKSNVADVISYIQNQREHHRTRTFQEEFLEFLHSSGIQYDARYLWG